MEAVWLERQAGGGGGGGGAVSAAAPQWPWIPGNGVADDSSAVRAPGAGLGQPATSLGLNTPALMIAVRGERVRETNITLLTIITFPTRRGWRLTH